MPSVPTSPPLAERPPSPAMEALDALCALDNQSFLTEDMDNQTREDTSCKRQHNNSRDENNSSPPGSQLGCDNASSVHGVHSRNSSNKNGFRTSTPKTKTTGSSDAHKPSTNHSTTQRENSRTTGPSEGVPSFNNVPLRAEYAVAAHDSETNTCSNTTAAEVTVNDITAASLNGVMSGSLSDVSLTSSRTDSSLTSRSQLGRSSSLTGRQVSERDCSGSPESGARDSLRVPIVGYEVMEQRARFTVFKLQVRRGELDTWFVFRRYTDFVRLNDQLKRLFPNFRLALPPKRWFGDNFDREFLDDRLLGLQAFVSNVAGHSSVLHSAPAQRFFCLDSPPGPHDSLEESRALCESLEEHTYSLQCELEERDARIALLQEEIALQKAEIDSLKRIVKPSSRLERRRGSQQSELSAGDASAPTEADLQRNSATTTDWSSVTRRSPQKDRALLSDHRLSLGNMSLASLSSMQIVPEEDSQEGATGTDSQSTGPEPQSTGPEPQSKGPDPQSTGPVPQSAGPEPQSTGLKPQATGPESQSTGSEPQSTGSEPQSTGNQPTSTKSRSTLTETHSQRMNIDQQRMNHSQQGINPSHQELDPKHLALNRSHQKLNPIYPGQKISSTLSES